MDLGGGGNSFQFEKIGDSVTGTILEQSEEQQSDMDTGKPAFWDNGKPKKMVRVSLQTNLKDDADDDGRRTIFLKGSRSPESMSSLAAVIAAVREATGGTNLADGGTLTLTYASDGKPPRRGYNAPKQYEAMYKPPKAGAKKPVTVPARGQSDDAGEIPF